MAKRKSKSSKGKTWTEYGYERASAVVDGKQVFAYGKTEKEATVKLAKKVAKIEAGMVELAGTMTVEQWYKKYKETYRKGNSEKTNKMYEYKMQRYVIDEIGNRPLKSIKQVDCQAILNLLDGKSQDYINKIYQGMDALFTAAVDNDLIMKNPLRGAIRPKGGSSTHRDITKEEKKALLSVCKTDSEFLYFLFIYYCGCRPGEADKIKGSDISKEKRLHIRGTKTKNADREVPIPSVLYNALPKLKPQCNVITGTVGDIDIYKHRAIWKRFKKSMNEYMIKHYKKELADDFVPYCLRHAYCCNLQRAGVNLKTAQNLMGHADIKTTANIYMHVDEDMLTDAAALIEAQSLK